MVKLRLIQGGRERRPDAEVLAILEARHPCAGVRTDLPAVARPQRRAPLKVVGSPAKR